MNDRIIHPLPSYRTYEVIHIESGRKSVTMKHDLSHTGIMYALVIVDISEIADFPMQPSKESKALTKARIAQVSEKEIEHLANSS